MIAAIYARKSVQDGLEEAEKSVTRQVEHATAFATSKGWDVKDAYVYVDDGVSGAEFGERRPGLARLLNTLKPKPAFQVLIMSEESRLGREQIETAYLLKQLITAGVRVWYYLDGKERTLDNPTDKILLAVSSYASEVEREQARARTYDAMAKKARQGHATGGAPFGYVNVPVNDHVERKVHPEQAAIVRDIFAMAAAGKGIGKIARELNSRGVESPRPRKGRQQSWAPSTVREILNRPLYRGEPTWGRTKKRDRWGQLKATRRAPDDWVRVKQPALAIVTPELWKAARTRMETTRAAYVRATDGRLWGRPPSGLESRYLLTGFTVCGVCGGSFVIRNRGKESGRRTTYVCGYRWLRDSCSNAAIYPLQETDASVLAALRQKVLSPEAIEVTIAKALARLRVAPSQMAAQTAALRKELAQLDAEIANLTAAVASGAGSVPELVRALKAKDERRTELRGRLDALEGRVDLRASLVGQEDRLRARLAEWGGYLSRNTVQARQILKKVLSGRPRPASSASAGPRTWRRCSPASGV